MMLTIQDAAAHIGVAASTLRYYDREGLLPFVSRSESGIRLFTQEDLEWLRFVECLKATGMSIKELKAFIDLYVQGDETLEQRRMMFYSRKQAVEEQMAQLQKTLDFVTYKCWFYDTAVAMGSADAPKSMKPEDLPADILQKKKNAGLSKL